MTFASILAAHLNNNATEGTGKIKARVVNGRTLRLRQNGGPVFVLTIRPNGQNINNYRGTLVLNPTRMNRGGEFVEEVHGRHTIGGEAVRISCFAARVSTAMRGTEYQDWSAKGAQAAT